MEIKLRRNEVVNWEGTKLIDWPRGSESSLCGPSNTSVIKTRGLSVVIHTCNMGFGEEDQEFKVSSATY